MLPDNAEDLERNPDGEIILKKVNMKIKTLFLHGVHEVSSYLLEKKNTKKDALKILFSLTYSNNQKTLEYED